MRAISVAAMYFIAAGGAAGAEITVLAPGNTKEAVTEIGTAFEARTRNKIQYVFTGNVEMREKLAAGEKFDVLISNSTFMAGYLSSGIVVEAKPFSTVHAVLVYRRGASKPDVTTPEALKKVIETAKSISHSDFNLGGGSASFYQSKLKTLGIEEQAESKAILTQSGQGAVPVNDGRAEIGIAQSSEVVGLDNVQVTILLPADKEGVTHLQTALSSKTEYASIARDLISALTHPDAKAGMMKWGFVD